MHSLLRCQVNRFGTLRSIISIQKNCGNLISAKCITVQPSKSYCVTKPYKAAILEEFNKKLVIEAIKNRTKLGQGMVRVGVNYCSLNLYDVKCMENESDEFLLPMIPGTEFSGEILESGDDCKHDFDVGEKVSVLLSYKGLGGGLAAECCVSETECFSIGGVSLKNAAVLAQGHGTALIAFTRYCELKENDILIVIAGPAGNGLAAIQLANSVFKAKIYAICDTEDSSALIREEGAYKSICISEGYSNVYKFLADALKDKRAKVVYDAAGGDILHVIKDFIDPNGHILTADPLYSPEKFASAKPEFKKPSKKTDNPDDVATLTTDDLVSKIKFVDITKYREEDFELYRQTIQDTLSLCEEEIITPYISHIFKLDDVNEAVEFIKSKKCTGKVLIDLKSSKKPKDMDSDSDSGNGSNGEKVKDDSNESVSNKEK